MHKRDGWNLITLIKNKKGYALYILHPIIMQDKLSSVCVLVYMKKGLQSVLYEPGRKGKGHANAFEHYFRIAQVKPYQKFPRKRHHLQIVVKYKLLW